MKRLILISYVITNVCFCYGQHAIEGVVVNELGEPIAGSNILEVGTSNGTISDLEGRFHLSSMADSSKIKFQVAAYLDQEILVVSDTSIKIQMVIDSAVWSEPLKGEMVCVYLVREFKVGLNSGLNHNQLGLETQNYIPYLGSITLNLNADVKWRFLTEDNYLNVRLRRYNLFDINNTIYVGLRAAYKSIQRIDNQNQIYSVSPELVYKGYGVSLGYARRSFDRVETSTSANGVKVEVLKTYFGQLTIRAGTIYWQDDWQYVVNIAESIPGTRFTVAAGWEQIGNWEEFEVSLLYLFFY